MLVKHTLNAQRPRALLLLWAVLLLVQVPALAQQAQHGSLTLQRATKGSTAWQFILATLARDSSDKILGMLAAGPLEDLLARHGRTVIARVETEARRQPLFAKLLGAVWQNAMPDDIWARVQAIWARRGRAGIPEA